MAAMRSSLQVPPSKTVMISPGDRSAGGAEEASGDPVDGEGAVDGHVDAEFFPYLARRGRGGRIALIDCSAGKEMRGPVVHLLDEDFALRVGDQYR